MKPLQKEGESKNGYGFSRDDLIDDQAGGPDSNGPPTLLRSAERAILVVLMAFLWIYGQYFSM